MQEFVHLHVHTDYSFQDGVTKVSNLVKRAASFNMPALALTDHGYLHGAIDFYQECSAAGIKPIIGVEAYVCPGSIRDKTEENDQFYHVTLIARNKTGYKNLVKMMTIAATDGFYYKPRIDKTLMEEYKEGLICLSGCMEGEIHTHLYDNPKKERTIDLGKAKDKIDEYRSIFGEFFFMEFMDHGIQSQRVQMLNSMRICKEMGLQVVATNDAHYATPEEWDMRDIVLADRTGSCLHDPNRTLKDNEHQYYLKSPAEMDAIWSKYGSKFIGNTLKIAEMVEVYDPGLKDGYRLPRYSNKDSKEEFKKLVVDGFKRRYPGRGKGTTEYERLVHEVKVIEQLGFRDYFLILQDMINHAESKGIPIGPGRGSAAGSMISYCLGITTLCPIENNLLFERFLNAGRKSMPDIDVDVCKEKRGQLIQYISERYGAESVAQIVTFGRMKGKGTIRAIGKVLEIDGENIEYLSSIMPPDAQEFTITLNQIINEDPEVPKELINKFKEFMSRSDKNKQYIDACVRLEGTYRTSGVHAAGIVIGPEPLKNIIPLRQSKDGGTVTQFSMEEVEALGLLKFDLLGLDTLSMVTQCLEMINSNQELKDQGPLKDVNCKTFRDLIPYLGKMDDKKVFEKTFSRGNTIGIFQCDSSGIRELLARMKASSFNDISAAIALYRPGPLDSGITESFIRRRNRKEKETVWVESARPYMADTHGLPIYQEQIMFISRELCGFSLEEADDLRKVIGKKKKEEIQKFREKFVKAAVSHSKIAESLGNEIYDDIEKFGRYGFNRSHSAAYAVICYATAWLKTYYPAHFMASLLQKFVATEIEKANDSRVVKKKDDEKMLIYLWETQSMGIVVTAPDIATSHYDFKVINNNLISFGLGAIKGIGPKLKNFCEIRAKNDGFRNFAHFVAMAISAGLTSRTVIDLDKAGCLSFNVSSEEKTKQFEGYVRSCRCVKARGTIKPDCKNCNGSGLGKTKRTIFDDIRSFSGSTQEEFDKFINELVPESQESTPKCVPLDSPNVYIISRYVKK